MSRMRSLFFPPKNRRIARIISIRSPSAFRGSIRELKRGGLTTTEKRALVLAQNRANAQLRRSNLSARERRQFREIKRIRLPKITKHRR